MGQQLKFSHKKMVAIDHAAVDFISVFIMQDNCSVTRGHFWLLKVGRTLYKFTPGKHFSN